MRFDFYMDQSVGVKEADTEVPQEQIISTPKSLSSGSRINTETSNQADTNFKIGSKNALNFDNRIE